MDSYSQSVIEKERKKMQALVQQRSDSTDVSYHSALTTPERPTLPYTISAVEWNVYSSAVKYLEIQIDEAQEWLASVLRVFTKVYTISKIFVMILRHYGVELDCGPDGVMAHLKRAEELATCDSILALIENVENLYYATYARLIMELANVELCSYFTADLAPAGHRRESRLPEPKFLFRILLLLQQVLNCPSICAARNKILVQKHQDYFLRYSMERFVGHAFPLDDVLGYRRFVLRIVGDPDSPFCQKWAADNPSIEYQLPVQEVLAMQSEKYLTFTPKALVADEIPTSVLPLVRRKDDPARWERELIRDHRQATLAKLEGRCIGDIRREDDRRLLVEYAKERKCTCRWTCVCAWDCTVHPERVCPCGDRVMRVMFVKHRKNHADRPVGVRCNSLARAVFQGLSCLKRELDDFEIGVELDRAFLLFAEEIQKQRVASMTSMTGYALRAKRPSRPFPPPFMSPPSSSFSDPLTTHYLSQDKRMSVGGELVRGLNNGDDAVLVADNFLAVNDGVGAWMTKPRGHAALWSRLLLHFWALEVERETDGERPLDPIEYLQRAYEETTRATTTPSAWYGTTTSVTTLLHHSRDSEGNPKPLLYVTNLGDCKVLVMRPREKKILFRTEEQWHWFDCPMQLGTNSVDTPRKDAVLSLVDLEEDDIVLAASDGVLDNLWEHEVLTLTLESLEKWEQGRHESEAPDHTHPAMLTEECMVFVARELLRAALEIAQDPYAESPYMEKAIEEGLAIQGGKMDDISVVVGRCRRRES
ncbi:phosphatase 2C-like domain-containing protein [Aspergillus taichungensis]|uniref:Protein phosphatase n=1 Tax=Aspergillus taichungensis TaxID=482145 RepID=A0A2J5HLE9_9EURO|nr:phosphatase 2C-like domain-containing protein [Aspergillus taichungensis]